jgi:hypothetical protein
MQVGLGSDRWQDQLLAVRVLYVFSDIVRTGKHNVFTFYILFYSSLNHYKPARDLQS